MRAIWKGSLSFGLINVPVALHPAVKKEDLKFRLLRASDHSPINYKRVAEADGREVPWDQIVKGYEHEKGKFVLLRDEDFARVDIEATDTIDLLDFVEQREVNPMYFYKPYYLEPQKAGEKAYSLLRDALAETGRLGIAKIVIRTRQHLAALKASGDALVLELMHFPEELTDHSGLKIPSKVHASARELTMAKTLISAMSQGWDPSRYTDDYASALMKVIEEKARTGRTPAKSRPAARVTRPVDLAEVLRESLQHARRLETSANGHGRENRPALPARPRPHSPKRRTAKAKR